MALSDESDLSSNGISTHCDPCHRTARCGDRFNGLLMPFNQPLGDGGVSQIHVQIDPDLLDSAKVTTPQTRVIDLAAIAGMIKRFED